MNELSSSVNEVFIPVLFKLKSEEKVIGGERNVNNAV